MAKALGAEIYSFFTGEGWPDDYYFEDDDSEIKLFDPENGKALLDLGKKYDLKDLGYLVSEKDGSTKSFASVFGPWKSGRTTVTIVLEASVEKRDEILAFLAKHGATIKS